jgi:hypothetical protein
MFKENHLILGLFFLWNHRGQHPGDELGKANETGKKEI